MNKARFTILSILTAMGLSALAQDRAVLYVPEEAPFQEGLHVRGHIKTECNLEVYVANDIAAEANRVYQQVVREKPKSGKYHELSLEIIGAAGAGGGAWSGPKDMEIKGILKDQGGRVIGNFTARRYSTGGFMAGVKGTCTILRRCSRAIGKDVATYLIEPTTSAHLGD